MPDIGYPNNLTPVILIIGGGISMFPWCKKWELAWVSEVFQRRGFGVLAWSSATENSYQKERIFSQQQDLAPGSRRERTLLAE